MASVIKYADSVKKSLATGLSVIISSALSVMGEKSTLSSHFLFGSFLALGSCHFFGNPQTCRLSQDRCWGRFVRYTSLIFIMYRFPHDLELKIERGGPERSAKLPEKWKDHVHVHVWQANKKGRDGCGGCRVLWELADSISEIGISVSSIINRCPNVRDLAEPLAVNKTIAIVYPEIIGKRCLFDKLYRVVYLRRPPRCV